MDSITLYTLYTQLSASVPARGAVRCYSAIPLRPDKNFFLAKLQQNSACLLIATANTSDSYPSPIQLENLHVQHGITGTILGNQLELGQRFSVVTLTTPETGLLGVFLRFSVFLCEQMPISPTPRDVAKGIRELADMLQCLRQPNKRSIQGLWAEMLLIANSSNIEEWFSAWHSDPLDLHDFCFSAGRIEVKSAAGGLRHHRFSHRQLWPPHGKPLLIASLLISADASGDSVFELAEQIRRNLSVEDSMRLDRIMLDVLGRDYAKAGDFCYDRLFAEESLRLFTIESVPRLAEELPDGIFNMEYSIDFSFLKESDRRIISDLRFDKCCAPARIPEIN